MATSEKPDGHFAANLKFPLLLMLLGYVAAYALVVDGYLHMNTMWGPSGASASSALAVNLLIVGAIWGLSKLRPSVPAGIALLVLLTFAGFMVSGVIAQILKIIHAGSYVGLRSWKTWGLLSADLLVLAGAIWSLRRLRPWSRFRHSDEPLSPATRRTNLLFGLSGAISMLALVAVAFGVAGSDGRDPVWSNSQNLSPVLAIVAIVIWLLSIALAWWWYYSADEHERKANDVGFLFGGGVFMAVTPIWWVASRAGLLPPPDAMILWFIFVLLMGIGWGWYRSR